MKSLAFIKILQEGNSDMDKKKKDFLNDFRKSLEEVKAAKQGKIELVNVKKIVDEL